MPVDFQSSLASLLRSFAMVASVVLLGESPRVSCYARARHSDTRLFPSWLVTGRQSGSLIATPRPIATGAGGGVSLSEWLQNSLITSVPRRIWVPLHADVCSF